MRRPDRKMDVYPKILPVGREVTININIISSPQVFRADGVYQATCYDAESLGCVDHPETRILKNLRVRDGFLSFPFTCDYEQLYTFEIHEVSGEKPDYSLTIQIYALEDDLFGLRPYKGDLHMHSTRSDGRECPAYVAASGRKRGLDFLAVTDHGKYLPSLEAKRAYEGLDIGLSLNPGEEVHLEGTRVHIINFGATQSVQELADSNRPKFRDEVEEIAGEFTDVGLEALRKEYATCVWAYRHIRESGGLAVFCHPYWYAAHRYNVHTPLIDLHFKKLDFDAFEYIGGCGELTNILQAARYHEESGLERKVSVIGASDTHRTADSPMFGREYTLAFAKSSAREDLVEAMRSGMSLAVEDFPEHFPRSHGNVRLVKYSQFLFGHVFPRHDDLCEQDAYWMMSHLAGDPSAADHLASLKKALNGLMESYWA